jgi:hypothetical protein
VTSLRGIARALTARGVNTARGGIGATCRSRRSCGARRPHSRWKADGGIFHGVPAHSFTARWERWAPLPLWSHRSRLPFTLRADRTRLKAQADIALMVTEEARERNASSSALLTANTSARG